MVRRIMMRALKPELERRIEKKEIGVREHGSFWGHEIEEGKKNV